MRKRKGRPLTTEFRRPLQFPLRGAKQIAPAFRLTPRQMQKLIAKGESMLAKDYPVPELNGYLTRALLPKDERDRYLPVDRERWEFIQGHVLSQHRRVAQKRNARGQLTSERDASKDQAHWVGTVRLVPTGKPRTYRIDKGTLKNFPNVRESTSKLV